MTKHESQTYRTMILAKGALPAPTPKVHYVPPPASVAQTDLLAREKAMHEAEIAHWRGIREEALSGSVCRPRRQNSLFGESDTPTHATRRMSNDHQAGIKLHGGVAGNNRAAYGRGARRGSAMLPSSGDLPAANPTGLPPSLRVQQPDEDEFGDGDAGDSLQLAELSFRLPDASAIEGLTTRLAAVEASQHQDMNLS